jgi:hypothetical protein
VHINWLKPYSGGSGVSIDEYEVKVANQIGQLLNVDECDGSDPVLISTRTCIVQMTTLTEDFGLDLGDLVVASVRAKNEKGYGQFSGTNTIGARVELKPQAPENGPLRGSQTDSTRLDISWEPLTTYAQRGGAAIDSYEL